MMHGFINVLKPSGMTSHDVVSFIRRIAGLKRVGHTGTLDPGAVGVLPVALGQATRLVEYVTDQHKEYRAEVTLGVSTDSGDAFGKVVHYAPAVNVTRAEVESVLAKFTGVLQQIPPMTSAIKVEGKKLYELARQGRDVPRPVRTVEIYSIRPVRWDLNAIKPRFLMDIVCGKGTYIRSLCQDIGHALGCGAYMSFLVRTATGDFVLEDALTLEELTRHAESGALEQTMVSMEQATQGMVSVHIDDGQARQIGYGQSITAAAVASVSGTLPVPASDDVRLLHHGILLAIGKLTERTDDGQIIIKPIKVLQR